MVYKYTTEDVERVTDDLSDGFVTQHELDRSRLSNFFSKKAAVDIFILLIDNPKPFNMINDSVPVSRTTVTNRLSEGIEIGLWAEDIQYTKDNKRIKLYRISKDAIEIADRIKTINPIDTYNNYMKCRAEYENLCDEICDMVDEER